MKTFTRRHVRLAVAAAKRETLASVHQEDVLPDGSVVAVVITPGDLIQVAKQHYYRQITEEQAREYLEIYCDRVVNALVADWDERLVWARYLDDFINEHGTSVPDDEDEEEQAA